MHPQGTHSLIPEKQGARFSTLFRERRQRELEETVQERVESAVWLSRVANLLASGRAVHGQGPHFATE